MARLPEPSGRRRVEAWREAFATYRWMRERQQLRDRPWLEDVLHWSADGELHGHVVPPPDGRRTSVTSDGWCPGDRTGRLFG